MKKKSNLLVIVLIVLMLTTSGLYALTLNQYDVNTDVTINEPLDDFSRELVMKNVHITTSFYDGTNTIVKQEFGSGVIYDLVGENYKVITNFHVVHEFAYTNFEIEITTYEGNKYVATYIRGSEQDDLALLEFTSSRMYGYVGLNDDYISPFELNETEIDDTLIAVGNPDNMMNVITEGTFDNWGYLLTEYEGSYRLIEHTATLDVGSSGGGLYNEEGRLVGLNSYMKEGKYYAISIEGLLNFILS